MPARKNNNFEIKRKFNIFFEINKIPIPLTKFKNSINNKTKN